MNNPLAEEQKLEPERPVLSNSVNQSFSTTTGTETTKALATVTNGQRQFVGETAVIVTAKV
ncbi:MAG TPA: hypothetical protein PKV50_00020 [Prolixibacteraceae bacterium]|nr:hypothetical protein [Prolixibacteraceae bacterium]HQN92480.1 hypothetical protein [Prolixibacteraceae bacterium]HUM87882.1 hypothetical protein [Prolixibacteraceae bacterium]